MKIKLKDNFSNKINKYQTHHLKKNVENHEILKIRRWSYVFRLSNNGDSVPIKYNKKIIYLSKVPRNASLSFTKTHFRSLTKLLFFTYTGFSIENLNDLYTHINKLLTDENEVLPLPKICGQILKMPNYTEFIEFLLQTKSAKYCKLFESSIKRVTDEAELYYAWYQYHKNPYKYALNICPNLYELDQIRSIFFYLANINTIEKLY